MALSIPPYTSITRGVGLPSQGVSATPLVVTAPSLFKSTKSLYSIPEPNVPDATVTGFLNVTPAILTCVFMIIPLSVDPPVVPGFVFHFTALGNDQFPLPDFQSLQIQHICIKYGTFGADPCVFDLRMLIDLSCFGNASQAGSNAACHAFFQ